MTFKIGKRVDIYRLSDLYNPDGEHRPVNPIFKITSQVMKFLGVPYFSPVDAETNPFHF